MKLYLIFIIYMQVTYSYQHQNETQDKKPAYMQLEFKVIKIVHFMSSYQTIKIN